MASTLEQFYRHLKTAESLHPLYLLASAEPLLLLEAADALRQRARALGVGERLVIDVERGFDWNDLARASAGLSLFASRRLIELRLANGKPGSEGAAAITEYCADPGAGDVLVVQCMEWSKQHAGKWVEAINRVGMVVEIKPVYANELPSWIRQRAEGRGLSLAADAVSALAELVEGNLLAAAQEIDKLVLLVADGQPLDARQLQDLVADHSRFNVFGLVDAALTGDGLRARRILATIRAEGEAAASLVPWLHNSLSLLLRLHGVPRGKLESSMLAERLFGPRQAVYKRALARGDRTFWEQRLLDTARVELVAKGRGDGDAFRLLERLLLAIADAAASPALALASVPR